MCSSPWWLNVPVHATMSSSVLYQKTVEVQHVQAGLVAMGEEGRQSEISWETRASPTTEETSAVKH